MTTTDALVIPTLAELFVDPRALPSPSPSVLEILRRADEPDVAMSDIADLVEADVSIAVQVLRMANSALYSPSREITTISRALASLGLRAVKLLALTTSLRSLVPQQSDAIDLGEIRHRMVVMASVARRAAQLVNPQVRDEAFVSGLLTGIGPIVLATEAAEVARSMLSADASWPDPATERGVLGFTSDDVTAELVSSWGLPPMFAEAVRRRHDVSEGAISDDVVPGVGLSLQIASLATPILTGNDNGSSLEALRDLLPAVTDIDDVDSWLVEAESAVSETAAMLQFRIPEDVAYSQLLAETAERLITLQLSLEHQLFEAEESADELVKRNDELELEASTDALTRLPNRRAFDRELDALMSVPCQRLGLLVIDLDRFKEVNDTHGHLAGDDVLRVIGTTLQNETRGDDFAARFGGEEFVMLIPGTSQEKMFSIAERLRLTIAGLSVPLRDGSNITVTASVGGAMVASSSEIRSPRALIEAADRQLYKAKQGGRNQTCLA